MRNIPHAVVMREYGTSRCLNQLASEFRVVAEEHLVMKEYTEMVRSHCLLALQFPNFFCF